MKLMGTIAVLCGILVITLVMSASKGEAQGAGEEQSRIRRGFAIAPVSLSNHDASVGLGSYIVNAQGGCNDCHTNPPFAEGGDPYQGQPKQINAARYLAGGTPFGPPCDPSTIFSKNLTPDAGGRPAGLTWDEFLTVFRTGRHPDQPERILQIMPWPVYGEMITKDLQAVYAFLSAIPSLPSAPIPPPFC
jgi:hypothetical protein